MYEFWDKYISDDLNKDKTIKPIIKNIESIFEIKDAKLRKVALIITLRGYFDDLIEYSNAENRRYYEKINKIPSKKKNVRTNNK